MQNISSREGIFLKTARDEKTDEVCLTSMQILERKISSAYQSLVPDFNPHYLDLFEETQPTASDGPIDLVFFGNFVRRFFESGNWHGSQFRLWVLSESVREVFVKIFGFNPNEVGLIERMILFPPKVSHLFSFHDQDLNLVYSGRVSPQKNIEHLIFFFHEVQKINPSATLTIWGSFDNNQHDDYGRHTPVNYKEKISKLVNKLTWTTPPRFMGHVAPSDWISLSGVKPVLVNFSTYICDDFGVAVAQAQESGWPLIISLWGGHLSIKHGAFFVSSSDIGKSFEDEVIIEARARALVHKLIDRNLFEEISSPALPLRTKVPSTISLSRIDTLRRDLAFRTAGPWQLLLRDRIDHYTDSAHGQKLYTSIRDILSNETRSEISLITYDYPYNNLLNHEIASASKLSALCVREGLKLTFYSSRDIFKKVALANLIKSHSIYTTGPFTSVKWLNDNVRKVETL